ncbi:glycolate oxidase subunit GlcF [Curvivirga aplysinae]|uniref:glycolate oxidase subunit GlcF n=1 Tax=Curvivirga aplysinae TaxID=2529852 RepID=UPI0012BD53E5|nr:glycolate oxidase subunit GlcF [Curvivirga aplysinae]MTI11479.1 glycolate oxidase subunit GlcF [Curvivirga aplysinae]
MQTNFSIQQLANPGIKEAESILRKCVHCGFCTATCPTYTLLGDELDSPRGRIYQIKDMLENERPASPQVTKHIDRCLSCLSCMTTCPSGVHYMHLVDHARAYIEQTHTRPLPERMLRQILKIVLPNPGLFRIALVGAFFAKPFAGFMPGRLKGLVKMAPSRILPPSQYDKPQSFKAEKKKRGRVVLMNGCAQKVLNTDINEATIRLLTRLGVEVVVAKGAGCCGALVHHMGDEDKSHHQAAANINAWMNEVDGEGLDAIVINASGCGTTVKDYGFMFRNDEKYAEKATKVSELAKDITEYLAELDIADDVKAPEELRVTYHSACSLQHGQKITSTPKVLLEQAGFKVTTPNESHLCCGSAGTYNLMQPEIANQLKDRKLKNIQATEPEVIAAGNIGCMTQIGSAANVPVVHTVELLDWANGGPKPSALSQQ